MTHTDDFFFILARSRLLTYIVASVCVFIVQYVHSKLHVAPKYMRFMSYSVGCCELIRLLKSHSVLPPFKNRRTMTGRCRRNRF